MNAHIVDFEIGWASGLASVFNSAQPSRNHSKVKTGYFTKMFGTVV